MLLPPKRPLHPLKGSLHQNAPSTSTKTPPPPTHPLYQTPARPKSHQNTPSPKHPCHENAPSSKHPLHQKASSTKTPPPPKYPAGSIRAFLVLVLQFALCELGEPFRFWKVIGSRSTSRGQKNNTFVLWKYTFVFRKYICVLWKYPFVLREYTFVLWKNTFVFRKYICVLWKYPFVLPEYTFVLYIIVYLCTLKVYFV